jgi:hypothetical protein
MLTEYGLIFGKRATACKHWQFLPGCAAWSADNADDAAQLRVVGLPWQAAESPDEAQEPDTGRVQVVRVTGHDSTQPDSQVAHVKDLIPNFSDPATLGLLLYHVRNAWKDNALRPIRSEYNTGLVEWDIHAPVRENRLLYYRTFTGDSEIEALVAALEGAP